MADVKDETRAIDWLGGYKHPGVPALALEFETVRAEGYAAGVAAERERCAAKCDADCMGEWDCGLGDAIRAGEVRG